MMVLGLAPDAVPSGEMEETQAIRKVCGVTDLESLDPDRVEYLSELLRHPVRINSSGKSELDATGLFTPYQVVSLLDYLSRHGQVLSTAELSEVDGFSRSVVEVVAPFLDFDDVSLTKYGGRGFVSGNVNIRGGYKSRTDRDERKSMYGFKSRLSFSDRVVLSMSSSEPYDSEKAWPTLYSGNIVWNHSAGKVVVGDFNARFGQGLCLWNTASFSSLTSPSYFMKRPSGLSASNSFTGTSALTGIASDFMAGKWKVSSLLSIPEVKTLRSEPEKIMLAPAMNLTRFGRCGHVAFTHCMAFSNVMSESYRIPKMMSAVDASVCVYGVNAFCEVAYDWVTCMTSALAGCEFRTGDSHSMAVQARYLPSSNEHAMVFAGEYAGKNHVLTYSAEGRYHPEGKSKDNVDSYQVKGQVDWNWKPSACVEVTMRFSERFRTWGVGYLTKLRADVRYLRRTWNAALRVDAVEGVDFACSGYVEGGYTGRRLTLYGRFGAFMVDNWDDRIYVYERDVPGNFNVPALYGRGIWISVYACWKFAGWGRVYVTGAYKKPGNAELKLELALHF